VDFDEDLIGARRQVMLQRREQLGVAGFLQAHEVVHAAGEHARLREHRRREDEKRQGDNESRHHSLRWLDHKDTSVTDEHQIKRHPA
jgi:hypothetical protein